MRKKSKYADYFKTKEFQRLRDEEWIPSINEMSQRLLDMRKRQLKTAYCFIAARICYELKNRIDDSNPEEQSKESNIKLDFDTEPF